MEYLKIKNIGLIDINAFFLIGASTKKDDDSKIGQFGTGLKYAIAYFIRKGIDIKLFCGEDQVKFSTKKEKLKDIDFEIIHCNDKSMNITIDYGYQWEAWEAIREIWCNAKDENKFHKSVKKSGSVISGEKGWTTFYIELTEEVKNVVDRWKDYFSSQKPIFENEVFSVYKNNGETSKFYKNGVLIKELEMKSLFNYDIKNAQLNELRQYQGNPQWSIAQYLVNTSKEVISSYLEFISKSESRKEKWFEDIIDWSWYISIPSKSKMKEIFSGFMFLHPESTVDSNGKMVKVNKDLFQILKDNGLPCEKVVKSSGGCYGGTSSGKEIKYKIFDNSPLKERVLKILKKWDIEIEIETAITFNQEFEVLVEYNKIIFNSDVERLSDDDLEGVVIIGFLSKSRNGLYNAFKRMLKANKKNPFLKQMILNEKTNF